MNGGTGIPKFESEAEEAQWWFDQREDTAKLMQDAVAKGETTNLAAILRKRRDGGVTPTVSIRIDPVDLDRARVLAERRGLRYQTYLKILLHEALDREDQRLAG